MIGNTIGRYKILEKLGEGGMGVVYKAEDTTLDRTVALKFLSPQTLETEAEKTRFIHEAKAAAALDHSAICTVYEVDKAEEKMFIAMAYVEGESLKNRIAAGPLKIGEALNIAIEIAEGLQEAHEKGVVHRDIKPANVMITPKGQVKIMDFGLAKSAKASALTKTGTTIGTVAYMSPEQARGEEVDERTDIWSLGAMLYELATGQKPFRGDYEYAVVYSILNQDPEPLTALRPGLPPELERIIKKAMAKNVEERYRRIADFLIDLRSLKKSIGAMPNRSLSKRRALSGRNRVILFSTVAVLLLALAAFKMGLFNPTAAPGIDSIAVLPLENLSGDPDQDYFADGMTEALIADLANIKSLKVISRTSVMRYKQTDRSLPDIARELSVDAIVEGTVLRVEDRVRITAQLIEGATDRHLWAEKYERDMRDVLALQSEVARAIAAEIEVKLSSKEQQQLRGDTAVDPAAYEAYLMGRYHWSRRDGENMWKSVDYFQSAIDRDPDYAMAYVGLAEAYIVLSDWDFIAGKEAYPKARELVERALEYDAELAEAHTALGAVKYMYDWDWPAAYREFELVLELKPNCATAHQWYAECLCAASRFDDALKQIDMAIDLDPLSLIMRSMRGYILYCGGRADKAMGEFQNVLEMDPDFLGAHVFLSHFYACQGMYEEYVVELAKALKLSGAADDLVAALEESYETAGLPGVCKWALERSEANSQGGYVNPFEVAGTCAIADNRDSAFEWLEKARQERSTVMAWIMVDPRFDGLRSDPRFDALVERMELKL